MAWNFRFYLDTGKVGGTSNPLDKTIYVDVYNGDDANTGAWNAPKQSIQGVLDGMASASMTEADIILASGVYFGGAFLNTRTSLSFIADGYVVLQPIGGESFNPSSLLSLNLDKFNGKRFWKHGKIILQNFSSINGLFQVRSTNDTHFGIFNVCFKDILNQIGGANGNFYIKNCINCVFDNVNFQMYGGELTRPQFILKNNIINNSFFRSQQTDSGDVLILSNFIDSTSKVQWSIASNITIDYNFYEGTLTNKINNTYSNVEAFKAAFPTQETNSLPSTTDPEFNNLNLEDFTLSPTSPLAFAGHDNRHIGAYDRGVATDASDANWDIDSNIDNTTTSGEAVLIGSPTGVLFTTNGISVPEVDPVVMTYIELPGFVFDASNGETISADLAANLEPNRYCVEIQYSLDDVTYSSWLKVPYGNKIQPLHDTVNDVGNADPLFDISNAVKIVYSYYKLRVTLRDNEIAI